MYNGKFLIVGVVLPLLSFGIGKNQSINTFYKTYSLLFFSLQIVFWTCSSLIGSSISLGIDFDMFVNLIVLLVLFLGIGLLGIVHVTVFLYGENFANDSANDISSGFVSTDLSYFHIFSILDDCCLTVNTLLAYVLHL